MPKKTIPLFLLLLANLACLAQTQLSANMFLQKLNNGLDVLVVEDNSVPLATIMITCKNGAITETPKFNGLSHLYEHMFFKANKDYPSQADFIDHVAELGIHFNGSTSYENVNYYFTLPKYNLKAGLKFMSSAIRYPEFNSKEIAKENQVVDAEFQRNESNPAFALVNAMEHHMWGNLYSRKNPIGDHDVIRNATPDLMDSIKSKYYYPNNCLLTIAGDVKHDDVFKQVNAIYGDWPSSVFDPVKKWPIPEFKPMQKNDYFVVESKIARVPMIDINWQGPDIRNDVPATYAADVFSYIINQNSSKLRQALVRSGLALQVSLNYLTLGHVGPISLIIIPNPDRVKECMAEAQRQIEQWDNPDYVTDEQIETAKRKLEITQIKESEVTSDYTHALSFWWASASLDYLIGYQEHLHKIDRTDLQNYIRKYIKGKPFCAGLLLGPGQKEQVAPNEFLTAN